MIGIYGGSFDPPHRGHLGVIKSFWKFFPESEKLILVPNFISPFKKVKGVEEESLLRMLEILIEENSLTRTIVDEIEIKKKTTSYTIETLEAIQLKYPTQDLYFIMGVDNLKKFPLWKDYEKILSIVKLFVFDREYGDTTNLPKELEKYSERIVHINNPKIKASSSEIRGLPFFEWVNYITPEVLKYIEKEGLYGYRSGN